MAYIGENKHFSFRDNICEPLKEIGSAESAVFGKAVSGCYRRFFVGTDRFEHMNVLFALCGGIAECGNDVYVCENTDLPSFLFGIPMLSAECGIFIGKGSLRFSFFNRYGFPLRDSEMKGIMNAVPLPSAEKCGKIRSTTTFRDIYINNIRDKLKDSSEKISASVSCGNKSIRELWLKFFTGQDDSLVFQISDDGQRVNAYSTKYGFISYEKLVLAYSVMLSGKNKTVYLPENFHYSADSFGIKRTSETDFSQRFLHDCLYMCVQLTADMGVFGKLMDSMPEMSSVKREIAVSSEKGLPLGKAINSENGCIYITQSGKNRLSLLAQSYSAETASELCSEWIDKIVNNFYTVRK